VKTKRSAKSAFTILELLVVIAVMAIMMGLVGFSFIGSGSGGGNLGQGQRQLLTLLRQTQTIAMSTGRETRLLVNVNMSDQEKFLRYMEVVVQDSSNSDSWKIQGDGFYLPNGIWLVQKESIGDDWPSDGHSVWSNPDTEESFMLSYPQNGNRITTGAELTEFKYISCNSSGVFQTDKFPSMPKLVIAKGNLVISKGDSILSFNDSLLLAGLMVQPFGGIFALGSGDFLNAN